MPQLQMRIGENLGEILLEICQENIKKGNIEKAIETYTVSLEGFPREYVFKLLKNECAIVTDEDGINVNMTDDPEKLKNNRHNITDWKHYIDTKIDFMNQVLETLHAIKIIFNDKIREDILDFSLKYLVKDYFGEENTKAIGIDNIAAKLIAGEKFSSLRSNGEDLWNALVDKVEHENGIKHEIALYYVVKYVENIRTLHSEYMNFSKTYEFLIENNLVERPAFLENTMEKALAKLTEFADSNGKYYNPICDDKLPEYRKSMKDDIVSTKFGKEFTENHLLEKNIMDGYDAGWLSPEGKFYGVNGDYSALLHMSMAEDLCGDMDGDLKLEKAGWMKIHNDEVYGSFIGSYSQKNDIYKYCPTKTQIKMACDYIDKFYNGKMYTTAKILRNAEPISTYKIRQMDEHKLHDTFRK